MKVEFKALYQAFRKRCQKAAEGNCSKVGSDYPKTTPDFFATLEFIVITMIGLNQD